MLCSANGEREYVDLHDYSPILTDEDEWVNVGDTIKVQKCEGRIGLSYFVFVEEVYE